MSTNTSTEQLIARWIEPNPHKPGPDEAWVLPARISVWALIEQLQLDGWDMAGVAEWYELPIEATEAATAFYHRNQAKIDERIARNNAYFAAL